MHLNLADAAFGAALVFIGMAAQSLLTKHYANPRRWWGGRNPERRGLNDYAGECHQAAYSWWHDRKTGHKLNRNKGELIALIHSEISEALEGARKSALDDKLPHRLMEEVELADALIRIFDYAGAYGYDIEGAYTEKLAYNQQRADHKPENRAKADGKKF